MENKTEVVMPENSGKALLIICGTIVLTSAFKHLYNYKVQKLEFNK